MAGINPLETDEEYLGCLFELVIPTPPGALLADDRHGETQMFCYMRVVTVDHCVHPFCGKTLTGDDLVTYVLLLCPIFPLFTILKSSYFSIPDICGGRRPINRGTGVLVQIL